MLNLDKYFLPQYKYFLKNINYEKLDTDKIDKNVSMQCVDKISVEIIENRELSVVFTRKLEFKPEYAFTLSVSYGVILTFNNETKNEINWVDYDLTNEIIAGGAKYISSLISRASLQIAQITSTFGKNPIITPPNFIKS